MNCKGSSLPLEDHHIANRENELHSSALNCIRLCKECHALSVKNDYYLSRYFKITLEYLAKKNYTLSNKDKGFIDKYWYIYEPIIQKRTR